MQFTPENTIKITCKAADALPLEQIKLFQGDLKTLSNKNREKLVNSICREGFMAPIFIWEDGVERKILDGHGRVKALTWIKKNGWKIPKLPVAFIQAETEIDARRKLLKITSQYGEFNPDELTNWLKEQSDDDLVDLRIVDGKNLVGLEAGERSRTKGDDAVNLKPPAITKSGDLWQLGKHKLLCGDATNSEVLTKLGISQDIDMTWTDPPYNVDIGEKNEYLNKMDKAGQNKDTLQNDNMTSSQFREFLNSAFQVIEEAMKPGGCVYVAHGDTNGADFRAAYNEAGLMLKQVLIWNKDIAVFGRQDYNWKHEPIIYGWKPGAAHYFGFDYTQTTVQDHAAIEKMTGAQAKKLLNEILSQAPSSVIDIDKPNRSVEHPTMKPVALVEQHIKNSSRIGETVLDIFGGSGTTLIAGEKTGRIARLIEKSPHYCDVIVNRYITWCERNGIETEILKNGIKTDF